MTTYNEMIGIATQYDTIVKLIGTNTLESDTVKSVLQALIDGSLSYYPWSPPAWWRTPEQQTARARQLWPNTVLPDPPREFVPQTKSEVPLLHVPGTFDSLWHLVDVPTGYTKYRWDTFNSNEEMLRTAPNKHEFQTPVWVAFDPEHGRGESPDTYLPRTDMAGSEILSALIQFNDWPMYWGDGASSPNLTGYQHMWGGTSTWSSVPCLARTDNCELRLELDDTLASTWRERWSSPTVREC
jgi:hypothetical protein